MSAPSSQRLYALAWRWHFYAGLLVIPIMLMLAITGIIYLFKPQLDPLMYPQLHRVEAAAPRLDTDLLATTVRNAHPAATLAKYTPPADAGSSARFRLKTQQGELDVFVDPYRGHILGTQIPSQTLQGIAIGLHGELLIGKWGDLLVELVASWGVLLLVSGLYLWWPRKSGWQGLLWPRWRAGKRVVWRDLHASGGFWSALLVLFLLLSGLPWTGFWGEKFADVWSRYPSGVWANPPQSQPPATRTLNSTQEKTVPWAVEPEPLPESDHSHHAAPAEAAVAGGISLARAQAIAEQLAMPAGYSISPPSGERGVYTLAVLPDDPARQRTVHLDRYSGRVLADIGFAEYRLVPKAVEYGIALHEGKLFGLGNQLIMLAACLLLVLSCVSGVVMWWKRRPAGQIGAPPAGMSLYGWKAGLLVAIGLGLLLPTVLASLLLVAACDLLLRALPAWRLRH